MLEQRLFHYYMDRNEHLGRWGCIDMDIIFPPIPLSLVLVNWFSSDTKGSQSSICSNISKTLEIDLFTEL